jgi:hypothetical protein
VSDIAGEHILASRDNRVAARPWAALLGELHAQTASPPRRGEPPEERTELTILLPCLNEAETLSVCIAKAKGYLARSGVHGEVLVADNGSTDGSQAIAGALGARIVQVPEKGYGAALIGGIEAARGRYIVMGDADDSYDFSDLDGFVERLREGFDLVMGNRFLGGIRPGAMPWKNRYIGNPVLSSAGRLLFSSPIGDFHCGLRGLARDSIRRLGLRTPGMEFASEMVVQATLHGLSIAEVPTTLSPDGRSRPPHLRPWRDGWRHLRFLLTHSPRWLLLYPGLLLLTLGLAGVAALASLGQVTLGRIDFEVHTLVVAAMAVMVGLQCLTFYLLAKQFGVRDGLLPPDARLDRVLQVLTVERVVVAGLACAALGVLGLGAATWIWSRRDFGHLDYAETMRLVMPASLLVAAGAQTTLAGFVSGLFRARPRP